MSENNTVSVNRNLLGLTCPIVLVGLMGAGKTTVGRRLARDIGLDFIDSDHEITEAAGCSIPDIFEIYGEPIFRDLEKRVILRLLSSEPAVIATGGGAFMNTEIQTSVREHAISIWLRAELPVLVERVSRRNTRPLLEQGDKRAILSRLIEERHPVYGNADLVVDSGDGAHETVVSEIIRRLKDYKKGTA
jgi:shikimate kinase/3-dehydroquinate synthase